LDINDISNFSLTLPYRTEFLSVVTTFVVEAGKALGANEKEGAQLRLAAEEVFTYIMEAFPVSEKGAIFHLRCEEGDGAIKFSFSNHGTPINARSTPEFTITDIDATLEGLGLSLAKQVTDSFECINCGSEGWLIVFSKQLSDFKPVLHRQDVQTEAGLDPELTSHMRIVRATNAHIPQMIDLVYRTYRYSYAKSYFYDQDSLQKALEEEKIVALLVENSEGNVVGNIAAFFDSPQLAEVGGIMIDPCYRSSMGMLLLIKESKRLFLGNTFKNIALYAKTVTTHTSSQQLMKLFKFTPMGLRLSVYNHAQFIGIDEERSHRESLVFAILTGNLTDRNIELQIPPEHKEISTMLFTNAGITAVLLSDELPATCSSQTSIISTPNEKALLMEIQVQEIGFDFAAVLKKETFNMQQNGFLTCILSIPTDNPLPVGVNEILKDNKYFFSGFQLTKDSKWVLVYTNLFHQRFQFGNVKLHDSIAQDLCNYMEEQYLSMY